MLRPALRAALPGLSEEPILNIEPTPLRSPLLVSEPRELIDEPIFPTSLAVVFPDRMLSAMVEIFWIPGEVAKLVAFPAVAKSPFPVNPPRVVASLAP